MRSAKCRSDAGPPSADQSQRLVGGFGHSCGKVSDIYGGAAYPAFTQFAPLSDQHQYNISERSAQTRHISELSAEYQRTIRRTSEHRTNVRGTSEQHQRIRPLAFERQRRISKLSVAQSAAYRQLRLSIRSDLCNQQFWMCAGKMSAQSGAIQAAFPVQSNRRFQSIPVTCSGRAAFGGSNGAATQQGYQGNGVTAGLHSKADLWRNPHRKPGHDPKPKCGFGRDRSLKPKLAFGWLGVGY